ncbi:MAG: porin family protein [Bacteroidota bacterium]
MPGNDFEKQVQQKMDELNFVPSAAVWPEVEKQIAGRRKRRVLFLWLPFLLLLLGGAAWIYNGSVSINESKKQIKNKAVVTASENRDKAGNGHKKTTQPLPLNDDKDKQDATENNIPVVVDKNNSAIAANIHFIHKSKGTGTGNKKNVVASNNSNNDKPGRAAVIKDSVYPEKSSKEKFAVRSGKRNGNKVPAAETVDEAVVSPGASTKNENNTTHHKNLDDKIIIEPTATDSITAENSLVAAKAGTKDSINNSHKTDTAKAITKFKFPGKIKKNIEWGISITAGMSKMSNGFSGLFSVARSYDPNMFLSSVNNGAPANSVTSGKPSDIKAGFAYAAGIFVSRQMGKHVKIMAGLNYNYYTTSIQTGAKIDSNKALIQFSTGTLSKYTNHFHFIELPVTVEKQLGKTSRFSVNAGLAFLLLAGSNALQYDAHTNVYVKDNSYINKAQVSLLAGFNYRLFQKTIPVEIGPQFNYELSNIYKKEIYGSRHLFVTGINAKVFFHKNKQ